MDFALPDLLNRDDIINIFNQRQLRIPNLNELTLDELLKVYKTFAMPLSKRPERSKYIKQVTYSMPPTNNDYYKEHNMQIEYSNSSSNAMDIDFVSEETNNWKPLRATERIASPVVEKRRQRYCDDDSFDILKNDYQYEISSVTKRIRINSIS